VGTWAVATDAVRCGWTALNPSYGAALEVSPGDSSAYATTAEVPPVPAGSGVEFTVDYTAGTCRVAFYTPAAVAGGFVEAPHAKMELRFVATEADADRGDGHQKVPARPVPTVADSGVELYPAASSYDAGAVWRLVP
jgi:hypothetical protein